VVDRGTAAAGKAVVIRRSTRIYADPYCHGDRPSGSMPSPRDHPRRWLPGFFSILSILFILSEKLSLPGFSGRRHNSPPVTGSTDGHRKRSA